MSFPNSEVHIFGPDGALYGVVRSKPPFPSLRSWLLHLGLFLLTFGTTTFFGGLQLAPPSAFEQVLRHGPATGHLFNLLTNRAFLTAGIAFSLPLMAILLAHEMGHYVACRYYRLDASLPYFLPVPFGLGTLGAFIRIRSPLLTKRELLAVGASGPLAGFFVTISFLVIGISQSQVVKELPKTSYLVFGEPLLFKLLSFTLHPQLRHSGDLLLHPTAFAAWFGLFVTALNLLPFGQLDGGHVAYAALGKLHKVVAWPLLLGLVALGFQWNGWWLWAMVALVMGVRHPFIPGENEPLDNKGRWIAAIAALVFLLAFTPEPIKLAS